MDYSPRRAYASPSRSRLPALSVICASVMALIAATMLVVGVPGRASATSGAGIWGDDVRPTTRVADRRSIELGTVFVSKVDGWVTALRFYKSAANRGPHVGKLWSPDGQLLTSAEFNKQSGRGWQTADLASPVRISQGKFYTVSYRAPHGRYADDEGVFANGRTISVGPLTAVKGVYTYGSRPPTRVRHDSNYYVDVKFVDRKPKAGRASPSVTVTPTNTSTQTSAAATPSDSATPTVVATKPSPSATTSDKFTPSITPTPSSASPSATSSANGSGAGGGCELPRYPTPKCTGVPAGTALQTVNGNMTVKTDGTQIVGKRITGSLNIQANNVVIKNSEIVGAVVNWDNGGSWKFTIEDSTVGAKDGCPGDYTSFAVGEDNYLARRVLVRGFPDGFRIGGPKGVTIEDSYVTLCSSSPSDHSDGVQAYGAAGPSVIRHNVIDQRPASETWTAPIFLPGGSDNRASASFVVTDNVVAGGTYSIRITQDAPKVTGNKILAGSWDYGPVDVSCGVIGEWRENAVVNFDFAAGTITKEVAPSNDCK
jgi:Domain of unknown function (DUF4082)